ncbi:MAG: RNA methyltransferase [Cucumibacter sp.]
MAGTDTTLPIELPPSPAIVLVEPQLGENIGMAARAMANFGLWDLRLVRPRQGWPNERAVATASHAVQVIERARLFEALETATADLNLVLATSARPRDMFKQVIGADQAAKRVKAHIGAGGQAGILFGRERSGLENEEIAMADAIVTLPVEPAFGSLNVAQAVVILAYEWRRAATGDELPFSGETGTPASREELSGLVGHLEGALDRAGFFPTEDMRPLMALNLKTMLTRAGFNAQEVRTLRGVISALDRKRGG